MIAFIRIDEPDRAVFRHDCGAMTFVSFDVWHDIPAGQTLGFGCHHCGEPISIPASPATEAQAARDKVEMAIWFAAAGRLDIHDDILGIQR